MTVLIASVSNKNVGESGVASGAHPAATTTARKIVLRPNRLKAHVAPGIAEPQLAASGAAHARCSLRNPLPPVSVPKWITMPCRCRIVTPPGIRSGSDAKPDYRPVSA